MIHKNYKAGFLIKSLTDDKYLLVKTKASNKWGPPKGHMNKHERLYDTAVRELYEETGIKVEKKPNIAYINISGVRLYLALTSEDIVLNVIDKNEITECCWISISELKQENQQSLTRQIRTFISKYNTYLKLFSIPKTKH